MSIDVVGNMLTSIRNACALGKKSTIVPYSIFRAQILTVLQKFGYIKFFETVDAVDSFGKSLKITMRYVDGECAIHSIKRVSTPGLRIYKKPTSIKPIIGGLGISVVSTSKGLLSDAEARKLSVGGEVLLEVW